LYFLFQHKRRLDVWVVLLHGALLGAFFLAVPFAEDSGRAFDKWLTFSYQTLVLPITLILLKQHGEAGLQRLMNAMAVCGLIALGLLYIKMVFYFSSGEFIPIQQLQEDNLPLLLPFMLAFLVSLARYRRRLMLIITMAVFLYILISDGRSALLGFLMALIVFSLLNRNWVAKRVLIAVSVGLLFSMITNADNLLRSAQHMSTLSDMLDTFTSLRTVLWRQALENPPDSLLIGIGMGNIRNVPEVIQVGDIYLGHLHNFVLDAWYETGFLGLLALLAFIFYPIVKLKLAWQHLQPSQRFHAGVWLAAISAILSSGM
jgi:O-antigen ligase